MTDDLLQLAREAIEDDKRATPGPWESAELDEDGALPGEARVCYVRDGENCEWCIALAGETERGQWTQATTERWRADAAFIASARTREPLLAAEVLRLTAQLSAVTAARDEACNMLSRVLAALNDYGETPADDPKIVDVADADDVAWSRAISVFGGHRYCREQCIAKLRAVGNEEKR